MVVVMDKELQEAMEAAEKEVEGAVDKQRKESQGSRRRLLMNTDPDLEWLDDPYARGTITSKSTWERDDYVIPLKPGHANFVFLLFGGKAERGEAVSESTRRDLY